MRSLRKENLPSSNEILSHMVLLDYQYRPSQILNIETIHQQQLAFSLRSANLSCLLPERQHKMHKHGWQGDLAKIEYGTQTLQRPEMGTVLDIIPELI